MDQHSQRNGTVDFLRFLFCCVIMLRHSEYALPPGTFDFLKRGALCVEFFFLVSGYLMVCSAARRLQAPALSGTGAETVSFMKRKLRTLLPTVPVAVVIAMLVTEISKHTTGLAGWGKAAMNAVWDFFMLPSAGFGWPTERWYISSMLLVMLAFYPILIKHFDAFVKVIAPLIAVFILGWIYRNYKELISPYLYLGHMYKGHLRAIGEIALGAALFPLIRRFSELRLNKIAKAAVTCAEVLCAAGSVALMATVKSKDFDYLVLLLMAILVVLTFSHQGIAADAMDRCRLNFTLGRISLPLYLSNVWVSQAIGRYYTRLTEAGFLGLGADPQANKLKMLALYLVCVVIATAAVYLVSALLRKLKGPLRKFADRHVMETPAA